MTAHSKQLQRTGKIPASVRFKTYHSAAPKPGNLQFAYEYEAMTVGGWSFNVINAADWVSEMPIAIQTLDDFNPVNPFANAPALIKKQKFPKNLALRYVFSRLSKPARNVYRKHLGDYVSRYVKTNLNEYVLLTFCQSSDYVRTGAIISLVPGEAYYKK